MAERNLSWRTQKKEGKKILKNGGEGKHTLFFLHAVFFSSSQLIFVFLLFFLHWHKPGKRSMGIRRERGHSR